MRAPNLRLVRPGELTPAAAKARAERSARRTMAALIGSVGLLTGIGLVMVLSASSVSAFAQYGSSFVFFKRQLLYAGVGLVAAVITARVPYLRWQRAWAPLFVATMVLLILVLHPATGTEAGGAARWMQLGVFSLQPSEVAKLALVAATAGILSKNIRYIDDPIVWGTPLVAVVGSASILILLQPDFGTLMVIAATVLTMLFVAGVRLRVLVFTTVVGAAAGFFLMLQHGYSRARLLAFLHPWADARNGGWQITQGLIALGSGHLFGVGLGASRQKWMYVPNAHTDFIFSILGEELGLLGEITVLLLFGLLLFAGVRIALRAPDTFGRLLAGGITAWIGVQALVNLGAVTGLLPITGVPLPFMSFGGSSLVISLAAMGILVNIARTAAPGGRSAARARPSARSHRA
jgi:cell division protein FtsW